MTCWNVASLVEAVMAKEIVVEEISRGVIEGLGFQYILMLIHKN